MKDLWEDQTFIGFDTETSGRFPLVAEIVELAAVKWKKGKIVDRFESFIKPSQPMGESVIRIHHITNEMVEKAPSMKEVLPKFRDFISEDSVLVAHHAPFDLGFLALEFENLGWDLPTNKTLCSCLLSRKIFPKFMNHRLATLVHEFKIKVENAHRALDDSRACLEAALKCMEALDAAHGKKSSLETVFSAQGGPLEWERFSMKTLENDEKLGILVEASKKQLVLEIIYEGGNSPGKPRNITPLGIVRNPEGDFMVGLCHKENKEKRYFLNRVSRAKILD